MKTEFQILRAGSIPVSASIWFLVLLGAMIVTASPLWVGVVWAAAVALSLCWHELGHAALALGFRLRPRILLHGFGGLCIHDRARRDSDAMWVTAAGPLAGLLLGAVVFGFSAAIGGGTSPALAYFLEAMVRINVGWSLANLLPLWPLDGGQLFRLFLLRRMDPVRAEVVTFGTGIALAVTVLLFALGSGVGFLPIMAGLLAYENVVRLHRVRQTGMPTVPPHRSYEEPSSDRAPTPVASEASPDLGGLRPTRAVFGILAANILIWLVFRVTYPESTLARSVYDAAKLVPGEAIPGLHLWQLGTYMWLHDLSQAGHVLANCLGLFFLGPLLERRWGTRDFLRFYLVTGVIAGVVSALASVVLPGIFDPATSIVGASGAVMALIAALSFSMPDLELRLFLVVPIRARYLVWGLVALDTLAWLAPGSDLAWQTHVGGVLGAWLLISGKWRPGRILEGIRGAWLRLRHRRLKKRFRVIDGGRDQRYLH